MKKIGFIGMGNMGQAMIKGLLKVIPAEDMIFSEADKTKADAASEALGVENTDNISLASQVSYLVLAIKPQFYQVVLDEIRGHVNPETIVISIAPGKKLDYVKDALLVRRVVRAMPNTPALVSEGMTGICYEASLYSAEELDCIDKIFGSIGQYVKVDERLMDVVVCASGSSPAYVYMMIDALADSAVKYGIPRDMAIKMVAQTVLGSAKMVLETGEHPSVLKDRVCSPGGTTIAGVAALEEWGFRNSLIKATDACYDKATSL